MFNIRKRYLTTLLANSFKLLTSFVVGIVVARSFGPEKYGDLAFLIGTATALLSITDLRSSKAFFTFISQKKKPLQFYAYYIVWLLIQAIFAVSVIWIVMPENWFQRIWLGHSRFMVMTAFFAIFSMQMIWQLSYLIGESIRETYKVQILRVALAVVHLLLICSWAFFKMLSVKTYFVILAIEHLFFSFILLGWIRHKILDERGSSTSMKETVLPFVSYCSPLIVISMVDFVEPFLTRWLLQYYGGSAEQGYFAVAVRFSTLVSLITVSATNILWKEMSSAHAQQMHYEHDIFNKSTKVLFAISAAVCCLFLPYTKEIIIITVGEEYLSAKTSLMVMLLVPAFASVDLVTKTFFLATERVGVFRNVWLVKSGCSILLGYFLLASPSASIPGFGLGSFGMAIRLFVATIVGIYLYLYVISKIKKWKVDYLYLMYLPPLLLSLSWGSKAICIQIMKFIGINGTVFELLSGVILYLFLILVLAKMLFQWLDLKDEWESLQQYKQKFIMSVKASLGTKKC